MGWKENGWVFDPEDKKTVHVNCRHRHDVTREASCDGTDAVLQQSSRRTPGAVSSSGGGQSATYRCLKCGGVWRISF